jgi:hypothetical protein
MPRNQIHSLVLAAAPTLIALLPGCGQRAPSSQEKLDRAQAALEAELDGWSRSQPREPFAANDPDCKAGCRLLSFLTADGEPVDATVDQFRFRVALALKDRQRRTLDKEVLYLVQMGDTISIRREERKPADPGRPGR